MKLPKKVFVRIEKDKGTEYLIAESRETDLIDGDGPTEIGVYELTKVRKLRKTLIEVT